jgi:hypothetical protein
MKKLKSMYEPIELYGEKSWIITTITKSDIKDNIATGQYWKDKGFTDEEMAEIAEKMADYMGECYCEALEGAVENVCKNRL